jgi:hypothetical protein
MGHIVQRFGISIGRGWIVLLFVVLAGLLAAYWIGPLRPIPPDVAIVTLQDGQPAEEVALTGELAEGEASLRFPLELAVQNTGTRTAEPRRVVLSVPGRYRVIGPRGRMRAEVTPGVPLRSYIIDLPRQRIPVGGEVRRLEGLEQIWLEPDLPSYYCTTRGDDIPEFIPAPDIDAGMLSEVRIFYSVEMRDPGQRSTGLLRVRVNPAQLQATPAPMPPVFPTVSQAGAAVQPDLGRLQFAGTRTAWCGDPDQPMELYTAMWQGQGGARVFSIHVQGQPRKRLYDLNGDGIIDLETWDMDGDGEFDAQRQARFATPEMLIPLPPRNPQLREPIATPADPQWLAVFHDAGSGPRRFAQHGPPPGAPGADTLDAGIPPTAREGGEPMGPLPPPDSAWLAVFDDVASGPFRFTRGPRPAPSLPDTLGRPPVAEQPPEDTVPAVAPAPRPPPGPRPLGTPVPRPPGGPRD